MYSIYTKVYEKIYFCIPLIDQNMSRRSYFLKNMIVMDALRPMIAVELCKNR